LGKRCAHAGIAAVSSLGKGGNASVGVGSAGFTLVELVIAMLISSLVMGIVGVTLGFSLRIWERQQRQNPSDMPAVVDLLKWQLATFEPQPVRVDQESMPIFKGESHSLTFATTHSVKAISRGAPVLVRYVFVPSDKALYYMEIPFDPYHSEPIEQFLKLMPGKDAKRKGFFSTAVSNVSFSFAAQDGVEGFEEKWEEGSDVPAMVVVKWSPDGHSRFTAAVVPNSLFPKPVEAAGVEGSAFKRKQ
jgi:prepilin-type N-terminal cleavage/methylation domain-containing protein